MNKLLIGNHFVSSSSSFPFSFLLVGRREHETLVFNDQGDCTRIEEEEENETLITTQLSLFSHAFINHTAILVPAHQRLFLFKRFISWSNLLLWLINWLFAWYHDLFLILLPFLLKMKRADDDEGFLLLPCQLRRRRNQDNGDGTAKTSSWNSSAVYPPKLRYGNNVEE